MLPSAREQIRRERERERRKGEMRMQLLSLLDHEKQEEKFIQRKLHESAMTGSITSLSQLLREYPLILSSTPPSSSTTTDTPLHVAALLGHLDFVRELLNRKPDLAGALNSDGSTPLHLASAKGYVEIVKELVSVNLGSGFVLDRDGRSPLHLAAIKGRVPVLTELVRVDPEAARVLTGGRGETCLHLCVKYNWLEALKLLVGSFEKDEFVNWKDCDGNTILHLAVAKKQLEIIKFLLAKTAIGVNTRNVNGLTALDVLSQSPRDLRDMEIKECLQGGVPTRFNGAPSTAVNCDIAEASSTRKQNYVKNGSSINEVQPKKHKHTDWLGRKRSALMVVASLIATVAFQAAISPPGGVWQDDYPTNSSGDSGGRPHDAGQSVMAYNIPKAYAQFMIFDTIAFLASLSIILLQVSGLPLKRRRWMWSQMITMWIAITAQSITYFISFIHMSPKNVEGTLLQVTKISVMTWLSLLGVVFIGNSVRVILWLLRKYGYIKEKEEPTNGDDDENDDL